eukprot:TRINITY_DN60617_c0_g1_i1.p1 TRINITY_DN60617_c0_g1~~TRINITY_DN60617_c0_g1_i1.p1  ORF type:complete len:763 (-),score=136.86 TRINITY_DN60617_c0_g1_i1:77-2365(-)
MPMLRSSTLSAISPTHQLVQGGHTSQASQSMHSTSPRGFARKGGGAENNPWHEVLQLCQKGFATRMETLTDDILADIRGEVKKVTSIIRQDVLEVLEARDCPLDAKLNQIVDKVEHIEKELHILQQQGDKHFSDLGSYLDKEVVQNVSELRCIQEGAPVQMDVIMMRSQMDSDFKVVLSEISRVQQALHVDFVQIQRGKHAMQMQVGMPMSVNSNTHRQASMESLSGDAEQSPITSKTPSVRNRLMLAESITELSKTRVREFPVQTDAQEMKEDWIQTDPVEFAAEKGEKKKKKNTDARRNRNELAEADPQKKLANSSLGDADKLRQKAREASVKPAYNVMDLYKTEGCAQAVARNQMFDNVTLFIVFLNAIWIGIDTDHNTASVLYEADTGFIIVENVFCVYFSAEILIRFLAFEIKRHCIQDFWFMFDGALVLMMVAETWIVTIIFAASGSTSGGGLGGVNMVRMIKLVKLLKLTRLTRILRAVPELVIVIKGIGFAARSVAVFFALWGCIIYIFGIAFKQVADGSPTGNTYFQNVGVSMRTLLFWGVFSESAPMMQDLSLASAVQMTMVIVFMALVSITTMYMLVGVLVDVVSVISNAEKEGIMVSYVAMEIRSLFEKLGYDPDATFTRSEFQTIMTESDMLRFCSSNGVDVAALLDTLEFIYEDVVKNGDGFRLLNFVDTLLNTRGSNPATVKDCKEQVKVVKQVLEKVTVDVENHFRSGVEQLRQELRDIRQDIKELASEDSDDDASSTASAKRGRW